jgi:hypothetical protein
MGAWGNVIAGLAGGLGGAAKWGADEQRRRQQEIENAQVQERLRQSQQAVDQNGENQQLMRQLQLMQMNDLAYNRRTTQANSMLDDLSLTEKIDPAAVQMIQGSGAAGRLRSTPTMGEGAPVPGVPPQMLKDLEGNAVQGVAEQVNAPTYGANYTRRPNQAEQLKLDQQRQQATALAQLEKDLLAAGPMTPEAQRGLALIKAQGNGLPSVSGFSPYFSDPAAASGGGSDFAKALENHLLTFGGREKLSPQQIDDITLKFRNKFGTADDRAPAARLIVTMGSDGTPQQQFVRPEVGATYGARPTATQMDYIQSVKGILPMLKDMENISLSISDKMGPQARMAAITRGPDAVLGNDPAYKTYQNFRTSLAVMASVAAQGSRPSDADVFKAALPMIPPVTATRQEAQAAWALVYQMFSARLSPEMKSQMGIPDQTASSILGLPPQGGAMGGGPQKAGTGQDLMNSLFPKGFVDSMKPTR